MQKLFFVIQAAGLACYHRASALYVITAMPCMSSSLGLHILCVLCTMPCATYLWFHTVPVAAYIYASRHDLDAKKKSRA